MLHERKVASDCCSPPDRRLTAMPHDSAVSATGPCRRARQNAMHNHTASSLRPEAYDTAGVSLQGCV